MSRLGRRRREADAGRQVVERLAAWHHRVPEGDELPDATGGMCRCLGDGAGKRMCPYLWLVEHYEQQTGESAHRRRTPTESVCALRDLAGQAMRRCGLHGLSGWWDAGTDLIAARRRQSSVPAGRDAEIARLRRVLEQVDVAQQFLELCGRAYGALTCALCGAGPEDGHYSGCELGDFVRSLSTAHADSSAGDSSS